MQYTADPFGNHPRPPALSHHARQRMGSRGLRAEVVERVLLHARPRHARGATIYRVLDKDVVWFRAQGIDVSDLVGIEVVCSRDEVVLTAYRNRKPPRLYKSPRYTPPDRSRRKRVPATGVRPGPRPLPATSMPILSPRAQ